MASLWRQEINMRRFDPDAYGNPSAKARRPRLGESTDHTVVQKAHSSKCANLPTICTHESSSLVPRLTLSVPVRDDERPQSSSLHTTLSPAKNDMSASQFTLGPAHQLSTSIITSENSMEAIRYPYKPKSLVSPNIVGKASDPNASNQVRDTFQCQSATGFSYGCTGTDLKSLNVPNISKFNHIGSKLKYPGHPANENKATDSDFLPQKRDRMTRKSAANIGKHPCKNKSTSNRLHVDQPLSMDQQLTQAQAHALKGIHSKQRAKIKGGTTSLIDLNLARKPIPNAKSSDITNARSRRVSVPKNAGTGATIPGPHLPASISNLMIDSSAQTSPVARDELKDETRNMPQSSNKEQVKPPQHVSLEETNLQHSHTSKVELKPTEEGADGNSHGWLVKSSSSQRTNESMEPLYIVEASHDTISDAPHPLAAWDGSIQPPPADWTDRPRFHNNISGIRAEFNRWANEIMEMTIQTSDSPFRTVTPTKLDRIDDHPDGISMVSRLTTVNKTNADHYGYSRADIKETIKSAQALNQGDFEDWGKIDMSRPENATVKQETAQGLIDNWTNHVEARRQLVDAQTRQQSQSLQSVIEYQPMPDRNRPESNIYLRPASVLDVPQMMSIYNWYIEHSPRPTETSPIEEEDMIRRLEDVRANKLPIIVAVEKSPNETLPHDVKADPRAPRRGMHPTENGDDFLQPPEIAKEKVVGWACATDFTASDYVEHIAAELEIYVDPAHCQRGLGRCLLDRLLEACDRGYLSQVDCPFSCPPEDRHLYSAGGGRDLHKLLFLVRKWKYPQKMAKTTQSTRNPKAGLRTGSSHIENDYDWWLKAWLESWGFEVEGILKGVGAKSGRFVDVVYLSRETRWQPAEGKVPDPFLRYTDSS